MPMTACQTPAQSFSATPLATSYPTTLFSLPPPASTRSLTYRPTLSIFSLYDKVLRRPVELADNNGQRSVLTLDGYAAIDPTAGNSHFATILVIKLKADLNPKNFSVIVVSYLLND